MDQVPRKLSHSYMTYEQLWGRCYLRCVIDKPSIFEIARVMLDVATPRCRAISAAERPASLMPRRAICPRVRLTFDRRLPLSSSIRLICPFLHSCSMIFISVNPDLLSFICRSDLSFASVITCCTKSPLPRIRSSVSSFRPFRLMERTLDHPPRLRTTPPPEYWGSCP